MNTFLIHLFDNDTYGIGTDLEAKIKDLRLKLLALEPSIYYYLRM